MSPGTERDLLRWLSGELPAEEARALHAKMEGDAELARAHQRLARTWQGLALPEPAAAPPGFATRVMARARERAAGGEGLSLRGAPRAVRALAATAVAVGVALGAVGAHYAGLAQRGEFDRSAGWAPASLADSYWTAFDEDDPAAGDPFAPPGEPGEEPETPETPEVNEL